MEKSMSELTPEEKRALANSFLAKADDAQQEYELEDCIEYSTKCIELEPDAEVAYKYRSKYIYKRGVENNCPEDIEIALSDNLNLVRIYETQQIEDPDFYDNYQGLEWKESAVTDAAWCYLQLGRFQEAYDTAVGVLERLKPTDGWKARLQNVIKFSKERAAQKGETLQLNQAIEADFAKPLK